MKIGTRGKSLLLAGSFAAIACIGIPYSAQADGGAGTPPESSPVSFEDDPGSETVPATATGLQEGRVVELVPEVVEDAEAHPPAIGDDESAAQSATKCTANGDTCQMIKGKKLKIDSWTTTAYQFPNDGRKCNILATFKYNVTIQHPGVWDIAKFPGCKTAPPRGYIKWSSPNVGPVTFSGRTYVDVSWTNGFGTTPKAEIHK